MQYFKTIKNRELPGKLDHSFINQGKLEELIKELLRMFYTDPEIVLFCLASISNLHMNYTYSPSSMIVILVDLISSSNDEEIRHLSAFLLASVIDKEPTCKIGFRLCLLMHPSTVQSYHPKATEFIGSFIQAIHFGMED